MRSAVFTGISAIWNFCNFWNSKQKFEIPALLQGGTYMPTFSSKKFRIIEYEL